MSKPLPERLREPEPEPEPVNPWNAVNALKVEIAAATAGGAAPEAIAALELQLSAAEAAVPVELHL